MKENKELPIKKETSNTDQKILALLDFSHVEELFFVLNILTDEEIKKFLEHYKKSEIAESKDKKLDRVVRTSKNHFDLLENIKAELIKSIEEEMQELKQRISTLTKKGKDVYVEHVKLMTAPLKLKVFGATSKKDDFYNVKKILAAVNEKIKQKEEEYQKERKEKELKETKEKEEAHGTK